VLMLPRELRPEIRGAPRAAYILLRQAYRPPGRAGQLRCVTAGTHDGVNRRCRTSVSDLVPKISVVSNTAGGKKAWHADPQVLAIPPDHCHPRAEALTRVAGSSVGGGLRCVLRAPGGPVGLDGYASGSAPRGDQFERGVWTGIGEQPCALADDDGIGAFRSPTAAATSPVRTVVPAHCGSVRLVDTTYRDPRPFACAAPASAVRADRPAHQPGQLPFPADPGDQSPTHAPRCQPALPGRRP
jgi:hypothetical protein